MNCSSIRTVCIALLRGHFHGGIGWEIRRPMLHAALLWSTRWHFMGSGGFRVVLFMTLPGLALFYGGLVRPHNFLSVVVQCFAICCVVSVIWGVRL